MSVSYLRDKARQNDLKGYSKLRKAELINFLKSNGIELDLTTKARQNHGFVFEDALVKQERFIKSTGYTSKFDATTQDGMPVQIKYIKLGSAIDMGDLGRNMKMTRSFLLYIGFWSGNKQNCVDIVWFMINDYTKWNSLFEFPQYKAMKTEMSLISNLRVDDARWKEFRLRHKKVWNSTTRFVQIRFKRDHKKQKRIQCAINTRTLAWFKQEFNGKN